MAADNAVIWRGNAPWGAAPIEPISAHRRDIFVRPAPGRAMHQLNPSRVVFPMFAQRIHAEPDCDAGRMD